MNQQPVIDHLNINQPCLVNSTIEVEICYLESRCLDFFVIKHGLMNVRMIKTLVDAYA